MACSDGGVGDCGFDVMLESPVPSPSRDRRSACAENDTGCSADVRNALGDIDATCRGDRGDVLTSPHLPVRRGFISWMPDGHHPVGQRTGDIASRHSAILLSQHRANGADADAVSDPVLATSTFALSSDSEGFKPSP